MPATETVQAAFGSELIATGSNSFELVYLPEGKNVITATIDGKPQKRTVIVDERVLASFQSDLAARLSDNVRPFAGFDHKEGPASMIPTAFRYESGVGLILEGELTQAGQAAIAGRNYSYWSPTYAQRKVSDKSGDAIPVGLLADGEIGSFVNNPAFRSLERVAASHTTNKMEIIEILTELGLAEAGQTAEEAVTAAKASLATLRESASTVESVTAARATEIEEVNAAKAELATKVAELETVKASLKTLEDEKAERVTASHKELIQAAIDRGAIPPQDEKAQAFWLNSLKADTESASAALASLKGTEAAKGESEAVKAGYASNVPAPISREEFDALSQSERSEFMRSGGKIAK